MRKQLIHFFAMLRKEAKKKVSKFVPCYSFSFTSSIDGSTIKCSYWPRGKYYGAGFKVELESRPDVEPLLMIYSNEFRSITKFVDGIIEYRDAYYDYFFDNIDDMVKDFESTIKGGIKRG